MYKIVISPFSRALRNGKKNPKNYPWWTAVVSQLRNEGIYVIQIGTPGEEAIGANEVRNNLSLQKLEKLVKTCALCVAVDNFLPHFCANLNKKCIVLFGKSDPEIFGYSNNINLLKDRKYLRKQQFDIWENEPYEEECFVEPDSVLNAIQGVLGGNR